MKSVLVIFFLSIQSSYARNTEVDATDVSFDTIQFVQIEGNAWRIRTYALDHDVHAWSLGGTVDDIVVLARSNTEKHYGDVLAEGYIIETDDGIEGLRRELLGRGLDDHLEIEEAGPVFWTPEGTRYRTQSVPTRA